MKRSSSLSNNKKRKLKELGAQAAQALGAQRLDVFERICAKIESIQPDNADVANLRGIRSAESGNLAVAEGLFVQAINAAPRRPEFHENLGRLYFNQQLYADAVVRFRSAMKYNPSSLEVALGCCASLSSIKQYEEALGILQGLRDKHPENRGVLMGLFDALSGLNRAEEALACLDKVVEREPEYFMARFQRAQYLMQLGRMQEGEADLRAALLLQPNHARAYAILSDLKKFTDIDDVDRQAIEACYKRSEPESEERVYLCTALGKAYADLQQYDRAFELYEESNSIRQRKVSYDADAELTHIEEIMAHYTPEVLCASSRLGDERPIFIVGMPRCGSSLVEQILAAHPEVGMRGEWEGFELAWLALQDAENPFTLEQVASFEEAQWREVGQAYLDRLEEGEQGRRITDKSLTNIRQVGAIHCALPHAKIIHVRRNPLDTCLSIYTTNIQGWQYHYGLSQGTLGYYYRMYQRLMQHWRDVLPEGVMYEIDYEQLIANQEDETRSLLDYCGLDWSDACMNFQKADTRVKTASLHQVRKSIFSSSVERWRPYEKHLQPLIRILGTG